MRVEEHVRVVAPRSYLTDQTAGSMIRNTFTIFFQNFAPLFMIYFIPLFPFSLLQLHGTHTASAAMQAVGGFGYGVAAVVTAIGLTVAVSDICLGNRPSVFRAYRRSSGMFVFRMLGTYLLLAGMFVAIVAAAFAIGALGFLTENAAMKVLALVTAALVGLVGSMVMFVRYMLTFPVMVLEPVWGRAALRRSRVLGQGQYLRNICVVLFCFFVAYVPHVLSVGALYGVFLIFLGPREIVDVILSAGSHIFGPAYGVASVLVYYDMRVRKEAYNIEGLAADLTV